jgi:hypothetical protein
MHLRLSQRFSKRKTSKGKILRAHDNTQNLLTETVKKWVIGSKRNKERDWLFLPKESDGAVPVAYIWARTACCQNPTCRAKIPLMRQYWLSQSAGKTISLLPIVSGKEVQFKIVGTGFDPMPQNSNQLKAL